MHTYGKGHEPGEVNLRVEKEVEEGAPDEASTAELKVAKTERSRGERPNLSDAHEFPRYDVAVVAVAFAPNSKPQKPCLLRRLVQLIKYIVDKNEKKKRRGGEKKKMEIVFSLRSLSRSSQVHEQT
jgi:hypothetical protein